MFFLFLGFSMYVRTYVVSIVVTLLVFFSVNQKSKRERKKYGD